MKLHRKIARLFGYELTRRSKHPTLSAHVINLISLYRIDLVLDVGANDGQFGCLLRDEGYQGEIHSFEPASHSFDRLREACLGDAGWFPHRLALGADGGEGRINITAASDLSSFLAPNDFGKERFEKMKVVGRETVKISTIDGFLAGKIPGYRERRIFLKMDTQGYDLQVLEGARNTMGYIACMLSEISLIPVYSGMPHYLDALRQYEAYGFTVTGLYPVSREKQSLSVIEMDCALVNRKNFLST